MRPVNAIFAVLARTEVLRTDTPAGMEVVKPCLDSVAFGPSRRRLTTRLGLALRLLLVTEIRV